ncbi:MAG: VOC family protein [Pseudomonadota bacterium]
MGAVLAHIAIEADDTARARAFYEAAFEWDFEPWGPPDFFHIRGAGVHGALQLRREPVPLGRKGIECTFAVRSLDDTEARVAAAGGTVDGERFTIPAVGTLRAITDTEGNALMIMAYEPAALAELGIDVSLLR